jgi:hypothetical protein
MSSLWALGAVGALALAGAKKRGGLATADAIEWPKFERRMNRNSWFAFKKTLGKKKLTTAQAEDVVVAYLVGVMDWVPGLKIRGGVPYTSAEKTNRALIDRGTVKFKWRNQPRGAWNSGKTVPKKKLALMYLKAYFTWKGDAALAAKFANQLDDLAAAKQTAAQRRELTKFKPQLAGIKQEIIEWQLHQKGLLKPFIQGRVTTANTQVNAAALAVLNITKDKSTETKLLKLLKVGESEQVIELLSALVGLSSSPNWTTSNPPLLPSPKGASIRWKENGYTIGLQGSERPNGGPPPTFFIIHPNGTMAIQGKLFLTEELNQPILFVNHTPPGGKQAHGRALKGLYEKLGQLAKGYGKPWVVMNTETAYFIMHHGIHWYNINWRSDLEEAIEAGSLEPMKKHFKVQNLSEAQQKSMFYGYGFHPYPLSKVWL